MDLKTATQKAIHYLRDYQDSKLLGKNISEIIQLYVRNIVAYVVKQEDDKVQRLYSKIEDLEHQLNLEKDKTKSIQKIHNEFKDNITDNNLKYVQAAIDNLVDLNNTIEGLLAGEECFPNTLKDCINFIPEVPYAQEESWIDLDELKLIPFTPEIMEKNKFKLNEKESRFLSEVAKTKVLAYDFPEILSNRFLIEYDAKNKVAYLTDHCYLPIRYVHEFQQLLRLMSTKVEQVKQILDNFIV